MVDVEQIALSISLPSDKLHFVAMQPYVQLCTTEPFQWLDSRVNAQIDAIGRTLDLAQGGFNSNHAHFTLFPEYSIPGIDGATIIDERIASEAWPNDTVIIAGVHGLRKTEYERLCQDLNVNVSSANAHSRVPNDRWVNCCLIWVKDNNGDVQRWAQLKIRPSWIERTVPCNDMFCGSTVYIFSGHYSPSNFPCNFFSLVCFDWIVSDAGTTVCNEVLSQLNNQSASSATPLDWVFVMQHNEAPNHSLFLNSTNDFFIDTTSFPFIDKDKAVVLHVNTAVSLQPSRDGPGAFSACVFSPVAPMNCEPARPTVCMQPERLRDSRILNRCKDIVFREMGECAHLFEIRVPRFVTLDATDKTLPINHAEVHAISEVGDPRLSGGAVPAALKWLNDSLDCVKSLSSTDLAGCQLNAQFETIQPTVISGMRGFDGRAAADSINWAACSLSNGMKSRDADRQQNADLWDKLEADALEHVIHSLTSLGLTFNLNVSDSSLHATLTSGSGYIQVIAIHGETHIDCRQHYDSDVVSRVGSDPVLVIARDRGNFKPTPEEYLKFADAESENGLKFLDYQTLATCCRDADNIDTLRENLNEFLPRDRRII